MKELDIKEIDGLLRFNKQIIPLYIYTPLCGTCKVTTKMLEVVEKALPDVQIYKCNLNLVAALATKWRIESVPCLLFLQKDQVYKKVYAFKSVHELYELLKPYAVSS